MYFVSFLSVGLQGWMTFTYLFNDIISFFSYRIMILVVQNQTLKLSMNSEQTTVVEGVDTYLPLQMQR